jgi:anaerobic selenocysteine-containing dehydrogenase
VPNGRALDAALASLEFMASVDFYVNETTRHANVILPPSGSLEHDSYEILFHGFAVRNTARYSPALLPPENGQPDDFAILSGLALRIAERNGRLLTRLAAGALRRSAMLPTPRQLLALLLRIGPHGDRFRPWRRGLRLADLERAPSGVDLGPLVPRADAVIATPGGRMALDPPEILAELARLATAVPAPPHGLVLIGRRDVRTNNSWLHNTRVGTKGRERCTLQIHPADAAALGIADGDRVSLRSRVGSVEAPAELTDDLMAGVVSLPHGWGHRGAGLRMRIAEQHPGVSCNDVVDDALLEPVVGNAVMNGVPVEIARVTAEPAQPRGRRIASPNSGSASAISSAAVRNEAPGK